MHPPGLYSFVTSKKMIPIAVVITIILVIVFYGLEIQTPQVSTQELVSPTPFSNAWKPHVDASQGYAIQYPVGWSQGVNSISTDQIKSFSFTEQGKSYTFTVSPPGQGIGEASLMNVDTVKITAVMYGGRNFLEKLWIYKSVPFLIQVIPNEQNFPFSSFSMELPPTNTDYYIRLFDQIMQKLVLPKELQVSPQPTLERPRTIVIPSQ